VPFPNIFLHEFLSALSIVRSAVISASGHNRPCRPLPMRMPGAATGRRYPCELLASPKLARPMMIQMIESIRYKE
jgi:hypothetical protein